MPSFPFRMVVALFALTLTSPLFAADRPITVDAAVLDGYLHQSLRFVINHGVDLYNTGRIDDCNQHFRRTLEGLAPLMAHRPELQKAIATALAEMESNTPWRLKKAESVLDGGRPAVPNANFLTLDRQRAFAWRAVLNEVRDGLRTEAKPMGGGGEPGRTVRPDGRELIPVPPAEKR